MNKLNKELKLILILIDGTSYTAQELCEKINVTRRQLYNYLHSFADQGFIIIEENFRYRMDVRSPFFKHITDLVNFSEAEAAYLHGLVATNDKKNPLVGTIRRKLEVFYRLRFFTDEKYHEKAAANLSLLREAISKKRIVCLKDYSSPHSQTVSDRIVEPFMFLNSNMDVRCYEFDSKKNKTFKLSRISSVEIYETEWFRERKHKDMFTDIFQFSGEEKFAISLRMGILSHNLMLEEYPHSECFFEQEDERHWLLKMDVASYIGIGRFIMGLFEDIEVLGDEGLKEYLRNKVSKLGAMHSIAK
jgi:predicted DNA-binding transcriptional regulator YafY